METAVSVLGLSKRYTIAHLKQPRYRTLREAISTKVLALASPARKDRPQSQSEDFWALRNVSFELRQGERLGIIGRNGAGKSTLLKLLSRITEPTEGAIRIRGRVCSLLEVGTGFHPELTGRENIFLNGTILGMTSREIRRKFDEIVGFSEIEQFLDTPVKHYSSGMYVRLAFSVAAHLEPEILIVDEVLAVGDAHFQSKCLGKMQEVNKTHGRTVIFVSHNMSAITSLCTRCLLIDQGTIRADGEPVAISSRYYEDGFSGKGATLIPDATQAGDDVARLRWARLVDGTGQPINSAERSQRIGIQMHYDVLSNGYLPVPNIHLYANGQQIFVSMAPNIGAASIGSYLATMWIPENFLNEGVYTVGIAASTMNPIRAHFHVQDGIIFNVIDDVNNVDRAGYVRSIPGLIRPRLQWSVAKSSDASHAIEMSEAANARRGIT